jgi:hypothetical protein
VGRTIYGGKHFIAWSDNSSNHEGTLCKVNGHHLKIFLEPEQPFEVVDEVDF